MSHRQLLEFISNEQFFNHVSTMVNAVKIAKTKVEKNPYSSVVDPFSALVDASIQEISIDDWMKQENARRIQKALQNAIGEFHQNILGSMKGWENAGRGGSYDVRNADKRIIAEIKNKYNTLNANGYIAMYNTLANHLDYGDKGFIAYYVAIITKKPSPYNKIFAPPRMGQRMASREDLRMIDGKSFYTLASGDPNALAKLYNALPQALAHVLGKNNKATSGFQDYDSTVARMQGDSSESLLSDLPSDPNAQYASGAFSALFQRVFGG